jgi:hypothetical protein
VGELGVVDAEQMQRGGASVVNWHEVFDDVAAEVIRLLEPDDAPRPWREMRCPSVGEQLRVQQRSECCDTQSVAAREVTLEKSGLKCASDHASHFFVTTSWRLSKQA